MRRPRPASASRPPGMNDISRSITARCDAGSVAVEARRAPEFGEPLPRRFRPAARQAVGQHDGVDRAGRRAGNAIDRQPPVLEQMVEHAPGERAVRAAALQREVDALLAVAPPRVRALAEDSGEQSAHCAVQPPSIEMLAPVMFAAASEAR